MNRTVSILLASTVLVGCAHHPATQPATTEKLVATKPAVDPKALLALDQIQPAVKLPKAATQPTSKPSLDAVALYAKARDEMEQNERFNAIHDYEAAIALDPTSAQLYQALAEVQLGTANFNDASIAALKKAADLQPDSLDIQLELGRQLLAKGDEPGALIPLRRAVQTTHYARGDDESALTDFYLATALQHEGYDRAALDSYEQLLERLRSPGPDLRENPEVNYLIARPDEIWINVGALDEKDGRLPEALRAFQSAARSDPENYELREHIVRLMTQLKQPQAKQQAVELVKSSMARPESVALLRDVYRQFGNEAGAIDVLRQLHDQQPADRLLLYALADTLQQTGHAGDSRELLASAAKTNRYDFDLVWRLLQVDERAGDWKAGARLLIATSATRPDLLPRLPSLWAHLLRPVGRPRVRLEDLSQLDVPADQQAVKYYWVATLAEADNRNLTADWALSQALAASPAYAPAYRLKLAEMFSASPRASADDLIAQAEKTNPALATELRGLVLAREKKFTEAAKLFDQAANDGDSSPQLNDEQADTLLAAGADQKAADTLRSTLRQWPAYESAYLQLVNYSAKHGQDDQTIKTVETWLANDPSSMTAKLLYARFLLQTRHTDAADPLLNQLIATAPDSEVLSGLEALYIDQGRLDELNRKLADRYAKEPDNLDLLQAIVVTDIALHHTSEASRQLDAARIRFTADAESLYVVANLYTQLDQKQTAEDVLQQALRADPNNPSANNDLGYSWADAGKNLDQAEQLIRHAVAVEPDNSAFLDSLGWALYKRGKFDESVKYLKQASAGDRPDPVVLDHLGDALYRANQKDDAGSNWKRANERIDQIGATRDDLKQLKLQLSSKLEKLKQGSPVLVAPVIQASTGRAASGI